MTNNNVNSPPVGLDEICTRTHQVFNQVPPLLSENIYTANRSLQSYINAFSGEQRHPILVDYGRLVSQELMAAGELANKYVPELRAFDRYGQRIEQVDYHPAYHQLMSAGISAGITSLPWQQENNHAHLIRTALNYLHMQADAGSGCPLTMTFAAVPVIAKNTQLSQALLPKLLNREYDPRNTHWQEKAGITVGMAMTEKQGGTDVRANSTRAIFVAENVYHLIGHKWFCSAPMSDMFLTLAQLPEGLSCFLTPRFRLDGSRNAIEIQRLKHKLGNHSNASSEIEYRAAEAYLLGDVGRGIATIIEMVSLTRVDCIIGSVALMQQALAQAHHHAYHRKVFGRALIDFPLMRNVLADIALEHEASLAFALRLAHFLDEKENVQSQQLLRLLTPVGKYFVCKRATWLIAEASEVLGGAGYIEETILPRLYREAPVNSIWEGSGNVQCLDVLRVFEKHPNTFVALVQEFLSAKNKILKSKCDELVSQLNDWLTMDDIERHCSARKLTEQLALTVMALTLEKYAPEFLAEAFIESRLVNDNRSFTLGCLPPSIDCDAILARLVE